MKKLKYSDDLEVEIDFNHASGSYMDSSGRFVLGEFLGRHEIPPSEAFKRSRKTGKKIEEIDPKLIPIKPAEVSDIGNNMMVGIATEDCKKGDMVLITTDGKGIVAPSVITDLAVSDKALPIAEIINMSRDGRRLTKPKKKKIKKDFKTKPFDYDDEISL